MQDLLKGGSVIVFRAKHVQNFGATPTFAEKHTHFRAFMREASCPTCHCVHENFGAMPTFVENHAHFRAFLREASCPNLSILSFSIKIFAKGEPQKLVS